MRVGSDAAYCGKSDHSHYGNCFCGPKIQHVPLHERLQAIVAQQATFWNVSMSFAVHNASVELAVAYGVNDFHAKPPRQLSVHDRIPMGSTTKMITATTVLRLAEKGTIQLDDPVAPGIDTYLSHRQPCKQAPAWCASRCWAHGTGARKTLGQVWGNI